MTTNREEDLPIMAELDAEYHALLEAELHGGVRRSRHRVARRSVLVLVLLCLVGTAALAARTRLQRDGVPSDSEPVLLGDGGRKQGRWELSGYRHHGRLCVLLVVSGDEASTCGATPRARGVRLTSMATPTRRFVLGLAGRRVAGVLVRVDGRRLVRTTRSVPDGTAVRHAGVPTELRWFVVSIAPRHDGAPARVTPLDNTRRPLGPGRVDCSLAIVGPACEHLLRRQMHRPGG